jgi:hypothetical protein
MTTMELVGDAGVVATSSTGAAAAQIVVVPSDVDTIVDEWFHETTSNRGLDVKVFNWLSQQRDELKRRLAARKAG